MEHGRRITLSCTTTQGQTRGRDGVGGGARERGHPLLYHHSQVQTRGGDGEQGGAEGGHPLLYHHPGIVTTGSGQGWSDVSRMKKITQKSDGKGKMVMIG